jgi:hypothetical protein
MIPKPDFLRINSLVRVNGYVGRIVDIAESDNTIMVRVASAKCARRFQKPDWLEYSATPDMWEPATIEEFLVDAEQEKHAAYKSVQAVEDYVQKTLRELHSSLTLT